MKTTHKHIRQILDAALQAADPALAIHRYLTPEAIGKPRRIWVIGAGKATAQMAAAVEQILGDRITGGYINVKYGHGHPDLRRIEVNECGHPTPDEAGLEGAQRIAQIANAAEKQDLVLCLISGGASALLPMPVPGMTLEQKRELTQKLLACGADIHEMNAVRKHYSAIKGGHLARLAAPARVLTLILSDVIGDDLSTIGSGPTAPDPRTIADAQAVLRKYKIAAPRQAAVETPKPGDPIFRRVTNRIIGSSRLALDAARERAQSLGYNTLVLSSLIEGETRDVARVHAAIAREIVATSQPLAAPACVISGGETTVTLRGSGLSGRNQEFALAAAIDIAGLSRITIASAGTDGTDGPTDAAGAIADGSTLARAQALGIDAAAHLANNDSYHFFNATGGLIRTGPTGTNVMDLRVVLVR